jgi:hypothetical protein
MKTKNISILLFILVFAGVVLLGYSQAQAVVTTSQCSNPGPEYVDCINVDDTWCICLKKDPGTGNPYTEVACADPRGCKEFKYGVEFICPTTSDPQTCDYSPKDCKGVNSWSHLTAVFPLCGASGLGEFIDSVIPASSDYQAPGVDESSCCIPVESNEAYWKFIPDVTCRGGNQWITGPTLGHPFRDPVTYCQGRVRIVYGCEEGDYRVIIDDCPAQSGPAYVCTDPGDIRTCDAVLDSATIGDELPFLCPTAPGDTSSPMVLIDDSVYYYQSCGQ